MKVSLKWLSEYVEVPEDLKAFCDRLDLTGTGVEGVERTGDIYDHVVTGQILEKEAHPDSDHMWVTKVDVGSANVDKEGNPEPLQIVCGAQNFNQETMWWLLPSVLSCQEISRSKIKASWRSELWHELFSA